MRSVSGALLSEGSSDDRFLPPVIERLLMEVGHRVLDGQVLVPPVYVHRSSVGPASFDRTVEAVVDLASDFPLIFCHRDEGGDVKRVEEWYERLRAAVPAEQGCQLILCCPAREVEAWMLYDVEAVAAVLGIAVQIVRTTVPMQARAMERHHDPKRLLAELARQARGPRRRGSEYQVALGEAVSIEHLRRLSRFSAFETEVVKAMRTGDPS